ncbi:MAG: ABC transporter ATP-binding protein [Bernardetiaceae bacterium]|jgi:putative ABC transport system ATP-binding protein|nr:ABC transporter ATP-binding protein [Bernardetiaceae bacterium]
MSILKTAELTKTYQSFNIETVALRGVNLQVQEGEFVSIMGPSGCGKSTLLNLLSLMDQPTQGELWFMGKATSRSSDRQRAELRRRYVGFVFQHFNLIEELSVYENVELPLVYQGVPARARQARVLEVLELLDVAHKQQFFPLQLSGGHQQRVAVARAMVGRPRILFADEPTGNLDSVHGRDVMNLLTQLNQNGTTIVMVTHSAENATYSHRTLNLFDGQVVNGLVSV